MDDLKNLEQAKVAFSTFCQALEELEWTYKKDEENLSIEFGARGDDLQMEIIVKVDADRMLVMLMSQMPFVIPDDKRLDVAVAVSAVNNVLVDGCFDYDVTSGLLLFRTTNSFMDSLLSKEVFTYMLVASYTIIDKYNDKFLMLTKGMISIEQFLSTLAD